MIDHPRCATCKHWDHVGMVRYLGTAERPNPKPGTLRHLPRLGPTNTGWCRAVEARTDGATATGHSYEGDILETRPDHYCPMHSGLTPA